MRGFPLLACSLVLGSSSLVFGCSGPLGPPLEAFDDGRLPEAAESFRRLEVDWPGFSRSEQGRYALYRGLVHLGLGDAREADRWLAFAKRLERDAPESFDAGERGELDAAWRSLGRTPGESGD